MFHFETVVTTCSSSLSSQSYNISPQLPLESHTLFQVKNVLVWCGYSYGTETFREILPTEQKMVCSHSQNGLLKLLRCAQAHDQAIQNLFFF